MAFTWRDEIQLAVFKNAKDFEAEFVKELEQIKSVKDYPSGNENNTCKIVYRDELQQIKCPNCGAGMVKRMARSGLYKGREFYGCEKFPKCRGIINID